MYILSFPADVDWHFGQFCKTISVSGSLKPLEVSLKLTLLAQFAEIVTCVGVLRDSELFTRKNTNIAPAKIQRVQRAAPQQEAPSC